MPSGIFTTENAVPILGIKNVFVLIDFVGQAFSFNIPNVNLYQTFSNGRTDLTASFSGPNISILDNDDVGLILEPDGTVDQNDYGWDVEADTSTASVPTVTITWEVAAAPTLDNQNFSLPENSLDSAGTLLYGIDSDYGNPLLTIVGGESPDQYLWGVNADGEVVPNGSPFDYEAPSDSNSDNVYTFNVTLTDDTGQTVSATVNVTITNVSEFTPSANFYLCLLGGV